MGKREHNASYTHILKYTGLFGGVQGLNTLVGLVRNKLVALILGPDGMGLMSLFSSTIKLASDSTNFGIGMSGVKTVASAYDEHDEQSLNRRIRLIRSWSVLAALLGMTLCIVLSPLLNFSTFSWGNHTLHFVLLSPVVAMLAITSGESAVLKATHQLKALAAVSVLNTLLALVTSIPLYYFFGQAGIVPSLLVIALTQMLLTLSFSFRYYPLSLSFRRKDLRAGLGMIKLGLAFVAAGIMGSGADFLIKSYLNTAGSLDTVGLFNAGYMMTMVYAGLVFSAMETDYFPRLSGLHGSRQTFNLTVNHQIEVSILIVAPLLVAFIIAQPILLPLLYSGKFLPAMRMIQVMILAMYLRAIKLPVAYIPLAKGDSKSYMLMESVYDVVLVLLVVVGYRLWGLTGTGIAIAGAALFDFVMLNVYMHWRYGYCMSRPAAFYCVIQIPFGLLAFGLTFMHEGAVYWILGGLLTVVSLAISLRILHQKTGLWTAIRSKLTRR